MCCLLYYFPFPKINKAAANGNWSLVTLSTFVDAGITGVTANNIANLKATLQGAANGSNKHWSPSDIQGVFDGLAAAQVIEAKDGKEGIEKALEFIPDIIISDIMMPKANGLELCETLKKDERTNHIPIILLTARTGEKTQFEGLETGADDYIIKPFKIKHLETRVKNLVTSRNQLRDRYSQEVILKPMDISISSIDQKFIERTQTVLDEHLTDPGLNIEDFSKHLGLSRMQLHRKLKAITGFTATEFVRSQRLKLAASLLEKYDVGISEICYKVGFNSPSYFSKCFKEAFGCLPSEYAQK